MLTSIDSRIRRRRVVLLAVLVLLALWLGTIAALTVDGHVHVGGSTLVTVDAGAADQIVEALLLLVGVIALPSILRVARTRTTVVDVGPPARIEPARRNRPVPPCLLTLCRIQV